MRPGKCSIRRVLTLVSASRCHHSEQTSLSRQTVSTNGLDKRSRRTVSTYVLDKWLFSGPETGLRQVENRESNRKQIRALKRDVTKFRVVFYLETNNRSMFQRLTNNFWLKLSFKKLLFQGKKKWSKWPKLSSGLRTMMLIQVGKNVFRHWYQSLNVRQWLQYLIKLWRRILTRWFGTKQSPFCCLFFVAGNQTDFVLEKEESRPRRMSTGSLDDDDKNHFCCLIRPGFDLIRVGNFVPGTS